MPAPRFFVPTAIPADATGRSIALPEAIAHHAVRVLRLAAGDAARLFDGQGGEWHGALERVGRSEATVRLERFDPTEREWRGAPTLVQAITAADAMDAAIRKAVELGVAAIHPVTAARSQGVLSVERAERRLVHWRSIAVAACEQCGRNRVPPVAAPIAFHAWLTREGATGARAAIAGPGAGMSLAAYAAEAPLRYVVIGPEGGFTDDEMASAIERGLVAVHLGPRVLRADTAAVAALAMIAAVSGDAR